MDPFFLWVEESALARFILESNSVFVFPAILVLHAVGMALLVGTNLAIGFRILGVAPRVPLSAMAPFVRFAWIGLGINVFSGILLLIAYPTKALTNPLFYFKMSFVATALIIFVMIKNSVFAGGPVFDAGIRDKRLAVALVLLWASTIAAGRFLAYTYTRLTVFH
jgi:hypothetical protein